MSDVKKCSKCGEEKPATSEWFYFASGKKDKLRSDCKACTYQQNRTYANADRSRTNARARANYHANQEHRLEKRRVLREARRPEKVTYVRPDIKACTRCGITKANTQEHFYKDKTKRDGLSTQCRDCKKETGRAYHWSNREQRNARSRIYRQQHEDATRQRNRIWYEQNKNYSNQKAKEWRETNREYNTQLKRKYQVANKEQIAEKARAFREANKERLAEHKQAYYKANPEIRRASEHRRRAREKQAPGSHTGDDIKRQYKAQRGKCYYCGVKVGDTYHIDHVIPLSRGGSNGPENIVIACPFCNISKLDKLPHEWPQGGRLL